MEREFTKGGFARNISPASKYPIIFAGRNTHIAQVISRGLPESEVEANCNLLAAADSLYDAVRAILFQVDQGKVLPRDACVTQARVAFKRAHGIYE